MPLRADSHGKDVVGVPGGFRPCGRQGDVQSDLVLVGQGFDPREAVRVGPHGVVDTREVDVHLPPAVLEQVGEQERHLVVSEGILGWPEQLAPLVMRGRRVPVLRLELVPRIGGGPPFRPDGAGQDVEEPEAAGHLPSAQIAGAG